eukprot:GILJ01000263.1.p1 GENE.GILJ01000263.1~~GILJ01000263.1.p1  ORF type:complete len:684 (-),score=106.61 GILJ01000263.1:88-2091(-)
MTKNVKVLEVQTVTNDSMELDIAGNETNNKNAFSYDLAPGEAIVNEMEVHIKEPPIRSNLSIMIKSILTFGLYYIWIYYCACCRPKKIGSVKTRLAVTNKNRVLLWNADMEGVQNSSLVARGNRHLESHTEMRWFHAKDLSFMQMTKTNEKVCFGCCKTRSLTTLRLFFGKYPNSMDFDAINLDFPIGSIVTMSKKIAGSDVAGGFALLKLTVKAITAASSLLVTGFQFVVPYFAMQRMRMLEIFSTQTDCMHDGEKAFDKMCNLQRFLLSSGAKTPDVIFGEVNSKSFRMVADKGGFLLDDTMVNVRESCIPLAEGEQIVSCLPLKATWTCLDWFYAIITFSLYYWFVLRSKYACRGALILTRRRLIEVFLKAKTHEMMDSYSYKVSSWVLDGISTGFIETVQRWTSLQVNTKFGAILIDKRILGSNTDRATIMAFWKKFSETYAQPLLSQFPASGAARAKSYLMEEFRPIPGEHIVKHITSEGLYLNPCPEVPVPIVQSCTCHIRPFEVLQELAITTHRVWGTAQPFNDPKCCASWWKSSYSVIAWVPLTGLKGWKINGHVSLHESCLTRLCSCWCKPMNADLSVSFGVLDEAFPMFLNRLKKNTDKGLMGDSDLYHLRQILATCQCAIDGSASSGGHPMVQAVVQPQMVMQQQAYVPVSVVPHY